MSEHNVSEALRSPQVKVCGLTRVDEAVACAEAGADAIGCVFFPPSPRHLTGDQARSIVHALPGGVCSVGVFVNEDFQSVMEKVEHARLKAVQLHGQESPGLVNRLRREGITVIKALFADGDPPFASSATYDASAYLLECAGVNPGETPDLELGGALKSRADPSCSPGGSTPKRDGRHGSRQPRRRRCELSGGVDTGT